MPSHVSRPSPSWPGLSRVDRRPRQAFVLVTVLFIVLILTLLVTGLLVMGGNLTRESRLRMAVLDTDIATESALNLVQTQIREATGSGITNGMATEAWASQPGAIRTFNTSGNLVAVHKLYSSDVMKTASKTFSQEDVPADWKTRPTEFVDLNEPVKRTTSTDSGDYHWIYPIVSPDSLKTVAGFSSTISEPAPGDPNPNEQLVMPVRWLYLSADGSMSADAKAGDPVARIAFWTDDESCKINVNTASATDSNSYWDIPRATLKQDVREMAIRQPAQNEFNRYPGHPATVSLTTVFPDLGNNSNLWLEKLIAATPRYKWGGSKNATVTIGGTRTPIENDKVDRLYATIDEFLYMPGRTTQLNLTEEKLEQSRFFLTASSRSSELNLFGRPRVTIWPVNATDDAKHRTAFDQLIAFCSTIGAPGSERSYFFLRSDSLSQTADWDLKNTDNQLQNQNVFEYLRSLTSLDIPGFGGNFKTKYDLEGGGATGERDQILTEIFDNIRCSNLNETYSGVPPGYVGYTKLLRDAIGDATILGRAGGDQDTYAGAGFVLPILTPYGRGAGRVPVVSEVGLWFIQTVVKDQPLPPVPKVQPGIIVETNTPMQGLMPWQAYLRSVEISASPDGPLPRVNGVPLPTGESLQSNYSPNAGIPGSQSLGGPNGWAWLCNVANTFRGHPFFTKTTDAIPAPGGIVNLTGGEIEIRLKSNGHTFQSYRVRFPSATLTVPDPVATSLTTSPAGYEGWILRHNASNYVPTFFPEDVVQSVALQDGDARVTACLQDVPAGFFAPHKDFGAQRFAHGFRTGFNKTDNGASNGRIVNLTYGTAPNATKLGDGRDYTLTLTSAPDIPAGISSLRDSGWDGDFDNGYGGIIDGAYMGKSDEGALNWKDQPTEAKEAEETPYFHPYWKLGDGLFSPLRQIPSAVSFGSLPTGVKRTEKAYKNGMPGQAAPWRTLAFCPNPANSNHYGLKQSPPDHLLLDLFTMPCVEPYAISEPFSMAGRLNMNCQIVPFTHIKRYTPMHAALAAQKIVAIPDSAAAIYKTTKTNLTFDSLTTRLPIDISKTLEQWETKFASGDIFKSASEICEQFLVPTGATLSGVRSTWWDSYRLTGDNSRERPYATIYPLLTTRSSTFTMHFRVQAIKRLPNKTISVLAEKRGSQLFERYIDPNDTRIGRGLIDPNNTSLEPYFGFRTLLTKRFDL